MASVPGGEGQGEKEPREASPGAGEGGRLGRLRRSLDIVLGREIVWAGVAVALFALLSWRSPWTEGLRDLSEGRIATFDLVVPIDVEIPDEPRTAEAREHARRAVDEVYTFEPRANARLDAELQEGFATGTLPGSPDPALAAALRRPGRGEPMGAIRQVLRAVLSEKIVARRDTLPQGRGITVRYFGETTEMSLPDLTGVIDLEEARHKAREAISRLGWTEPALPEKAGLWVASLIRPTLTYDLDETRRRMDEAARQVPVLYSRIPKGKVLVRKGQPLTREVIRDVVAITQASPRGFDTTALLGMLLISVLMIFFLWRYAADARREPTGVRHLFAFLVLTLAVHTAVARGSLFLVDRLSRTLDFPFDRPESYWYLIPSASGAVLATLLAGGKIGTVYSLFASLILAVLFDWNLPYAIFALLTHLAGVYGTRTYRTRSALLKAGGFVGFTGAAAAAALDAVRSGFSPWQTCLTDIVFAFLGGAIGVPLLVSFLLPIFEGAFGVLTDIRLLELSNLDNPLLSELAMRAPGSYNHSIIVGTLADAAAEAIGANTLFCRVAAYYHDIGKMKMPEYYIENQRSGENPHDRLAPSMSAMILSNHVKEGIRLGREHGLPQAILDIIPQHHGTRVMTYFYEKARQAAEAAGGAPPSQDDFRHPGPKPATKEAAIFMLADSVEAAARTVDEPGDERFRDMIRQIAGRIILDGQFDRCDLTFRDLEEISDAFVRCLMSIHHQRIDYPTFIFNGAGGRRGGGQAPGGTGMRRTGRAGDAAGDRE